MKSYKSHTPWWFHNTWGSKWASSWPSSLSGYGSIPQAFFLKTSAKSINSNLKLRITLLYCPRIILLGWSNDIEFLVHTTYFVNCKLQLPRSWVLPVGHLWIKSQSRSVRVGLVSNINYIFYYIKVELINMRFIIILMHDVIYRPFQAKFFFPDKLILHWKWVCKRVSLTQP